MLNYILTRWLHRQEGGWTLSQLIMGLAISAIGIGSAFALLGIGQRHTQRGEVVTGLQQYTRTAIEWLSRELRESAVDSIVISGENSSAIAFASARDASSKFTLDENGRPQWQQAIVYYLKPGTADLYRYTVSKTNWSQNFNPDTVIQETLGEKIGREISQLSFTLNAPLLTVTLETTQETKSGAVAQNRLTTNIMVRNRL